MALTASPGQDVLEVQRRVARLRTRRDPVITAAVIVLAILVVIAIVVPLVSADSSSGDLAQPLAPPSMSHPMGTDDLGRDVFTRFSEGARISLGVAVVVVLVGALVGGAAGVIAGAFTKTDGALMRTMDAIMAFPPLVLAMAVTVGFGAGLLTAALGIALTSIPWYARLVRSEVLRIRSLPFIEAAVALGASRRRIVLRHIVPHLTATLFIQGAAIFGYAILTLAALGFVGLGAQVPTPEWGTMITEGQQYTLTGQWWISVFPGIGLLIVVTTTSLIADRARDLLDPRGRYMQV
jgi:peptide/nickel transport system permease protein